MGRVNGMPSGNERRAGGRSRRSSRVSGAGQAQADSGLPGGQHPEGEREPVGWGEDRFAEWGMDRSVCVEPRAGERG